MTRIGKILVLWFAALTVGCIAAQAQNCNGWDKVTAWTGTYTLIGSGSASDVLGQYTWTVNHQASGEPNLNFGPSGCAETLQWRGLDSSNAGSILDTGNGVCPVDGTPNTVNVVAASPEGSNGSLIVNLSNGTYTFSDLLELNGTMTQLICGKTQVDIVDWDAWPSNADCTPNFNQLTFPLPASVQVLEQNPPPFTANTNCPWKIPVLWTLNFTLTPTMGNDNVDDDCSKEGGSSIGCQNQSLGEDVPVSGTGFFLHYEGDRAPGRSAANGVAAGDALSLGGWTLNVHHAYDPAGNILFLGDGGQRSAWQLGNPVTLNGNTLITSQDGAEVYVFDPTGRHLQTLKPMTGAVKYQFGYDVAGSLITVTDGSGNVTTISRNSSEEATEIVSAFGQTTTLREDNHGFLVQVTDPAGKNVNFTNTTSGLMTARIDANGNVYNYAYDSSGRLTTDSDPAGGSTTVSRTDSSSGYSVTTTTAVGRTSTFQVTTGGPPGEQLTNTWTNGLQATETNTQQNGQLSENTTLPDGTSDSKTLSADPRWGLQAPVPTKGTRTLGNLTMTTTGSRTATLGVAGNPFSLTTQTDTATINKRKYTSVFTASTKTYVDTTPVKRTTTTVLDSLERISSAQVGALLPVQLVYDSNGRLSTITQGTRTTSLAYDSSGFLASTTDPLKLTNSFTRDADGRPLTTTLPDGRVISYSYDANGNVTSVTPPGKSAHDFSYTAVDLTSVYTPPTVSGTGVTTYEYNADRDLTKVTRPDGGTITFNYDSAGRLSSTTTPTETTDYAYDTTTGNPSSAAISGGEAIAYGYNGPLPTSSSWTGMVAGSVSRAYNDNFWVTSESINGGNTVNFTYDNDGLLTKAGSLAVTNDPKDGLLKTVDLGSAKDSRTYDTLGELTGYTAKYGLTTLYSLKFTRDADGRITTKAETLSGKKNTFTYVYDTAGRLTSVKQNGTVISTYTYDTNSNRLTATTSSGTVTGTYDAQDRLLTYGNASYTYTANGELASMMGGSQTTTYSYDVLGNLIAATLPNGTTINYTIDAKNRRVGKEVNGILTTGFLYDGSRIVAQLNGTNAIVSQFIYASGTTAPDYMVTGGVTYRIFTDHLGSPRLVVNTSTGAIAEQIDYDEFGNVINDTNPGFQPFGFAGGLYDQDTKLVRFGTRDYNPATGRWTAKDRILFAGGDTNLYGYVLDDPINLRDPSGKGLEEFILGILTSWTLDIANTAITNERINITNLILDTAPFPGSSGVAVQFAADPENALNMCTGVRSLSDSGKNGGISPKEEAIMQQVDFGN